MNPALIFALAVMLVLIVGGVVFMGDGSLRRGLRKFAEDMKGELPGVVLYAGMIGLALLLGVLADGDALTFIAMAVAGAVIVAVKFFILRRRRQ